MTLFNRRQAIATLGAATAVGLAAPALAQNRKITVGALRFTSHAGSFVGFERDYFKEAGLDVELRFFEAAQPMAVAIASGDVDYAITAISGGLVSLAQRARSRLSVARCKKSRASTGRSSSFLMRPIRRASPNPACWMAKALA